MRRVRGFTLVELIVVVALIGILAATIVPAMTGSRDEARVRACARELVSLAKLAWSRAVTTSREHRLRVSQQSSSLWIEERLEEGPRAGEWALVEDLPGARLAIPDSARVLVEEPPGGVEASAPGSRVETPSEEWAVAAPSDAVVFSPDGTTEHRRWIVHDRAGSGLVLETVPLTGRVRVVERGLVAGRGGR